MDSLIPVTIITGFLGAGKTTLLNRILSEEHGHKIAVIENEFGEVAIDTDLLVKSEDEDIITMSNGCICCTIRGDLAENLVKLAKKKKNGETEFERLLIETTGVADPGPITQTFFMDEEVAEHYMVDSVITVVDAINGSRTLDESEAAQAQAGFADRILLSKIDIADKERVEELTRRLHFINPRAPVIECSMGNIDLNEVLDVHGFNLDNVLELDPDFLKEEAPELCEHDHHDHDHDHEHGEECACGHDHDHDHDHDHHHEEGETCSCGHDHHHTHNTKPRFDDQISAFVFHSDKPFDPARLDSYMRSLTGVYGPDMLRYKGILYMKGTDRKMIFQGVHMLMAAELDKPWGEEKPESKIVFIGRKLPKKSIIQGLETCLAE